MSFDLPCECTPPRHAAHQHDNVMCTKGHLGIGGCPGDGHCRDWVIGAYRAGIKLAEIRGAKDRLGELHLELERIESMEWPR